MRFIETEQTTPLRRAKVLKYRPRITRLCRTFGVELFFLHGSLAKDRHGPLSDIDLAIVAPQLDHTTFFSFQQKLIDLFGREDIDLALLNRASPLLAMQVLTKGIPLYVKSAKLLRDFRLHTYRTYLDHRHFYDQHEAYVLKAAA